MATRRERRPRAARASFQDTCQRCRVQRPPRVGQNGQQSLSPTIHQSQLRPPSLSCITFSVAVVWAARYPRVMPINSCEHKCAWRILHHAGNEWSTSPTLLALQRANVSTIRATLCVQTAVRTGRTHLDSAKVPSDTARLEADRLFASVRRFKDIETINMPHLLQPIPPAER